MWCSDDEYCDRIYQRWQKVKEIISKYEDTPVDELKFMVDYLKDEMEENSNLQSENDKLKKILWRVQCERWSLKIYAKELEKMYCQVSVGDKERHKRFVEHTRGKTLKGYMENWDTNEIAYDSERI